MTTGQDIHDMLPLPAGTVAPDTSKTLKALKWAIASTWPALKINKSATAGTVAQNTYQFSLAALTDITEWGVAEVLVAPTGATAEPDIRLRDWRAYNNDGVWTLVLHPKDVSTHIGKAITVRYQARVSVPTALTDTLSSALPLDFLINKVCQWYAMFAFAQPATSSAQQESMIANFGREADKALRNNMILPLSIRYAPTRDRWSDG
jgi:hypothetical protein